MSDKILAFYLRDSANEGGVNYKMMLPIEEYRWEYKETNIELDLPANTAVSLLRENGQELNATTINLGSFRVDIICKGAFYSLSDTENTNATEPASSTYNFDGAISALQLRENFIRMVANQNLSAEGDTPGERGPLLLGIPRFTAAGGVKELRGFIRSYNFEEVSAVEDYYPFNFAFTVVNAPTS